MIRLSYIVLIGIALACVVAEEELYSNQYDDIDIKAIFENEKLRQQYYNCFMEIAPCKTAPLKFYKEIFPEAFQTQCKKCTEKQKKHMEYIIDWYTTNKPNDWNALVTKIVQDLTKKSTQ
ncbi:ejaculatory bulb-specific protein 3 [Linepithema humile]|uniref:ejaculatory bulb-specific protein 3 n=1 Tax=Linepithema humile TaxID=83485 RepID=UPI0006235725|nr:PREDICTED: ejaculatory bulb-specific protein 3-like [Linepithema humile]